MRNWRCHACECDGRTHGRTVESRAIFSLSWIRNLVFYLYTTNTENLQIWSNSNDVVQIKYTDLPYIFLQVLDNLYCNFPSRVQFYRPVKNRSTASSHQYQPMQTLIPHNLTGHFYHKKHIIPTTTSLTIVHTWVQHIARFPASLAYGSNWVGD